MRTLLWIGAALVVLWLVSWLVLKVTGFLIHLLLLAGLVLLVVALVRRGAGAVKNRM